MEISSMMGLIAMLFFVVYLLISIWAVTKAVGWAKTHHRKPWLWGVLVGFVMYNLVFWDLIPTLILHKYYCDTQAGFWVYKTPEQWRKENPTELENIQKRYQLWSKEFLEKWKSEHPSSSTEVIEDMLKRHTISIADSDYVGQPNNSVTKYHINHKFNWVVNVYPVSTWLPIYARTQSIIDVDSNTQVFSLIDFWYRYIDEKSFSHLKIWMVGQTCNSKYQEISNQNVNSFSKIEIGESK